MNTLRFSQLEVGARFKCTLLDPRVKVWEKTNTATAKGITARGKTIRQLMMSDPLVEEVK